MFPKQSFFHTIFIAALLVIVLITTTGVQAAPLAATESIGGTPTRGNLRITVQDDGTISVEQYDGTQWQHNFYDAEDEGDSKGAVLHTNELDSYDLGGQDTFDPGDEYADEISNTRSGSGTSADPWIITTELSIDPSGNGPVIIYTQVVTYIDGNQYYDFTWTIENVDQNDSFTDLVFIHGCDTQLAGTDEGSGWWTAATNDIGVSHPTSGQEMWLRGITPPDGYDSIFYGDIEDNANDGELTNTVDPDPENDNGYAMEWRRVILAPTEVWTIQAREYFVPPEPTPEPETLPATGFPMGRVSILPEQPASKAYADTTMILNIPKLGVSMPIVGVPQSGDSWDVTWLRDNAGWLNGSAFPTWAGNSVLTAHVWDAWNLPGPFAELKTLKYGDQFNIHAWGLTYTYEVRESKVYWAGSTVSKVFQHEDYDWVTLLTCETYNPFNGDYFFRRAVRAVLISVK